MYNERVRIVLTHRHATGRTHSRGRHCDYAMWRRHDKKATHINASSAIWRERQKLEFAADAAAAATAISTETFRFCFDFIRRHRHRPLTSSDIIILCIRNNYNDALIRYI